MLTLAILAHAGAAAARPSPRASSEPDEPMTRRSTGLMVTGIVITSLGTISSGIGGVMMLAGVACPGREPGSGDSDGCGGSKSLLLGLGAIWLGGGTAGIGLGVPLWFVGAQEVPVDDEAWWRRPTVAVGPGTIDARWRF